MRYRVKVVPLLSAHTDLTIGAQGNAGELRQRDTQRDVFIAWLIAQTALIERVDRST